MFFFGRPCWNSSVFDAIFLLTKQTIKQSLELIKVPLLFHETYQFILAGTWSSHPTYWSVSRGNVSKQHIVKRKGVWFLNVTSEWSLGVIELRKGDLRRSVSDGEVCNIRWAIHVSVRCSVPTPKIGLAGTVYFLWCPSTTRFSLFLFLTRNPPATKATHPPAADER